MSIDRSIEVLESIKLLFVSTSNGTEVTQAIDNALELLKEKKQFNRVERFAKRNGFSSVRFINVWNGYKCYEPLFDKNEVSYTGMPLLILEDANGRIRMSTEEEAFQHIDECN